MGKVDMVMPQMGESIAEGTIIKWLKKEGEKVEKDEIILEISTDKVDSEIPSPQAGVITKLLFPEGETVNVGAVIAQLDAEGESDSASEEASTQETDLPAEEAAPALEAQPDLGEVPAEVTVVQQPKPEAAKPQVRTAEIEAGALSTIPRTDKTGRKFYSPLVRSIARPFGTFLQHP